MGGMRFWVHNGVLEPFLEKIPLKADVEDGHFKNGSARLVTGNLGTEVKWNVNSPCVSSLFTVIQWLPTVKPPYILRFFATGWFEEIYHDHADAINRVEQILARGDRHFTSRVFIEQRSPNTKTIPDIIKQALRGDKIADEYSVDCSYDPINHLFKVERIGPQSAIGRVWGTYPSSYPCQSAGSFGDPVSASYEDVMRTGKPRYDHVVAALRLPDNAVHWVPYQRVVLPYSRNGQSGVAVLAQISRVDIQVL